MSGYIERDDSINNDTMESCSANIISKENEMEIENRERWAWLIDDWDNMSFMERMSLFMPYHHYMNLRNSWKKEFDDVIQAELTAIAYKECRSFKELKFDPDGQGIPNLILVYNPIDVSTIPDMKIRASVRDWGNKFGFLKCECQNCRKTSEV